MNNLTTSWCLWAHLPHDSNWSPESYIKIHTLNTVEEIIAINETIALSEVLIKYCMFFLMRDNIPPLWEDDMNKHGGYFSYKVQNKIIMDSWKKLTYSVVGNTISSDILFNSHVNGITISPKKHFCILKVWMRNGDHINPDIINKNIPGVINDGCIFKKHNTL